MCVAVSLTDAAALLSELLVIITCHARPVEGTYQASLNNPEIMMNIRNNNHIDNAVTRSSGPRNTPSAKNGSRKHRMLL